MTSVPQSARIYFLVNLLQDYVIVCPDIPTAVKDVEFVFEAVAEVVSIKKSVFKGEIMYHLFEVKGQIDSQHFSELRYQSTGTGSCSVKSYAVHCKLLEYN